MVRIEKVNNMERAGFHEKAYYHLPGLFEFYEFYSVFLPLYRTHRDYFYDWCDIGSIYGAPADCLWGGGRAGFGEANPTDVMKLMQEYGISARLTFSNSLVREEHLSDRRCNDLCRLLQTHASETGKCPKIRKDSTALNGQKADQGKADVRAVHGVIVHSDLLAEYLQEYYPDLYLVSSTTKVLTDFNDLIKELDRREFCYVVPDFRLNKAFDKLDSLTQPQKDKIEFLCNECCSFGCLDRKACYENVSRKNLGESCPDHYCTAPDSEGGYRFSKAMKNPGFISVDDIKNRYLTMGFSNYKIEGRSLGSALLLEFILYYMTKPEYQINVREEIYLDNMLDLF